jgi:Mn-dependent DtxR family transcriptional regulator
MLLLTQEYLAAMLGARRPTVTLVAKRLQRAGLIDYHRGRIVIQNRPGLARLSCECYGVVRSQFERLIP